MPKQMAYTDDRGNVYPASYWRLESVVIDHGAKQVQVLFSGWRDASADPAKVHAIGTKRYMLSGSLYDQYADSASPAGLTRRQDFRALAETYALACRDTPAQDGTLQSFFAGATDVS